MGIGARAMAPVVLVAMVSLACGGGFVGSSSSGRSGSGGTQDFGGDLGPKSRDVGSLCLKGKKLYVVFDECASTCGNHMSTCVGYDKRDRYEVQTTYAVATGTPRCDDPDCFVRWLTCNLEPDPKLEVTIGAKTMAVSSLPACPEFK